MASPSTPPSPAAAAAQPPPDPPPAPAAPSQETIQAVLAALAAINQAQLPTHNNARAPAPSSSSAPPPGNAAPTIPQASAWGEWSVPMMSRGPTRPIPVPPPMGTPMRPPLGSPLPSHMRDGWNSTIPMWGVNQQRRGAVPAYPPKAAFPYHPYYGFVQQSGGLLTEIVDGMEEEGVVGILGFCWMMIVHEGLGVVIFTGFAIMVCCLNEYTSLRAYMDVELVAVLGTVVSLVLGFKITDSSSRWWEARKVWSALQAASRSLAQLVWLQLTPPPLPEGQSVDRLLDESRYNLHVDERARQIGMLQALGVAVKLVLKPNTKRAEHVRGELIRYLEKQGGRFTHVSVVGTSGQMSGYVDMVRGQNKYTPPGEESWLYRLRRSFTGTARSPGEAGMEIPRWIVVRLNIQLNRFLSKGRFSPEHTDALQGRLCELETAVADMTRLATYPIPASYARQLRLAVWAFLVLLPFQMYRSLRWFTIPVQCLAAIIYLGFLEIGVTPSDPFKEGYSGMNIEELVRLLEEDEQQQRVGENSSRLVREMTVQPDAGAPWWTAGLLTRQDSLRHRDPYRR